MTSPASDVDQISDKDVRFENVRAVNNARWLIVLGMFVVFALTAIFAIVGAVFGRTTAWSQMSPVIDTLLAGEFAIFGSIVAFYMTRQD